MSDTTNRNIHISINGKEVVNSLSGIGKAINQTNRDISNLNKNDADYQEQLKKHQTTLALLRAEYGRTKDEIRGVPGVLKSVENSLGSVASGMLKAFSVTSIIGAVTSKIAEAKNIIVDFDQAQGNLAGVLETTRIGIVRLTLDSLKYGNTTSWSATKVTEAQTELARLGKTQIEIRGMTQSILDGAIALEADLAPAAELVGGQMNSYGASANQASKFTDILANSVNISATSFSYLETSLPKVSKAAALAGIPFEKLNGIMGVLSDESIAAETAGTSFRNILLKASDTGRNYEDMLKEVAQATDKLGKANELFGSQNAIVAVTLATSTDKIKEQTEALENSLGSSAKLAETKLDTIKGSATIFSSAWEGLMLAAEDGTGTIAKVTRNVIDFGTELIGIINPMRQVSDELKDEQLQLNILVDRINSSNTSNEERKKLLDQLRADYPDFVGMIDDETLANESLQKALNEVNEQYHRRILLQAQLEKTQGFLDARTEVDKSNAKVQLELFEQLQEAKIKLGSATPIDFGNLEESAKRIIKEMEEADMGTKAIQLSVRNMEMLEAASERINDQYVKQAQYADDIKTATGEITEAERTRFKLYNESLDSLIEKAKKLGGVEGKDFFGMNKESVQRFVSAKELELENSKGSGNRQKTEKELEREQKIADRKKALFEKGEQEIDKIIQVSLQSRESRYLTGTAKEIRAIENKYALELVKYKDHANRLKELELARDEEISELKREKANEYALQIFDIEKAMEEEKRLFELEQLAENASSEEERQLLLIEKARYVADLELEIEMEKELAKVEAVENAEDLKQAIRDKYAQQKAQNDTNFNTAEKALKSQQVDWTRLTEKQKLDITIGALNAAADAFNEGSGAWKAIKIAETVITTYQSATSAFNALSGIPIVGPALGGVAAGLAIVTGLKNVQKIASTDMQKMPSFYYGGYTGSATGSLGADKFGAYTGMTHENEWVAPAFMTQSPRYAPTLQWLENERQMGVSGGSSVSPTETPSFDNSALLQLSMMIGQLSAVLENGIDARTIIGYEEMIKMSKLNEDIDSSSKFG